MAINFRLNRLLSIPFALNVFAWLVFSFLMFTIFNSDKSTWEMRIAIFSSLFILSYIPYFLTKYLLIPKLLFAKKYLLLFFSTIITILIGAFIYMMGVTYVFQYYMPELLIGITPEQTTYYFSLYSWNTILVVFTAGGIELYFNRKSIETLIITVQNEKSEAELTYLKNQINPHLLISVMETLKNNILNENEKVKESVATFTELLNYQLFECTNDHINIEKEIIYLKSYIGVQSNRMEAGSDIKLETGGELTGFYIAPLLILPLVENAFKYVSHFNDASQNKIHISIKKDKPDELWIKVINSYEDSKQSKHLIHSAGIGLVNLRRRLELLYEDRHSLRTETVDGFFVVELSLTIN